MKIVIDARMSGTSTGRYIDKLIEHLYDLRSKHEIVVLTKPNRLNFFNNIAPDFGVVESTVDDYSFGEQLELNKQLKSLNPDLVHFGMVQQPVLYKGKVVTTIHDLTTLRFINPSKNPIVFKIKQRVYAFVIKKATKKSKKIIVPSNYVKEDLINYTGVDSSKIVVTYESADFIKDRSEPVLELDKKQFIMYVGRPTPHKNLERLIEAFVLLKDKHPDLVLALAGQKDSNYELVESKVKAQGIKNVVFTGFISDGQLRWMYENCSAYAFPSLSEGFGLPGLEAMVHGAPVVSSNATCLPEVYGDAAIYFNPLNTEVMAESINEVLVNKKLRDSLVKKGKSQASKYSWKTMAEQTLAVYEEVLRN